MRRDTANQLSVRCGSEVAPVGFTLSVRAAARLRRLVRTTKLPPEVLVEVALELAETAVQRLAPAVSGAGIGLATARWRNVSREARSEVMRRVARARWAKPSAGKAEEAVSVSLRRKSAR